MGCLGLLLPIVIIIPVIIFLLLLNVISISYSELGLSQTTAIALLIITLLGSMVNIPVTTRQIEYQEPQSFFSRFLFYTPPRVTTQTIAVNLGGALIPVAFAVYLMPARPGRPH